MNILGTTVVIYAYVVGALMGWVLRWAWTEDGKRRASHDEK